MTGQSLKQKAEKTLTDKGIRAFVTKKFGSVKAMTGFITFAYSAGLNPLPMLRHNWSDEVNFEIKHADGEPRSTRPGTLWICHNKSSDSYYIRIHEGVPVERTKCRSVKLSDIKSHPVEHNARFDSLTRGLKRKMSEVCRAS